MSIQLHLIIYTSSEYLTSKSTATTNNSLLTLFNYFKDFESIYFLMDPTNTFERIKNNVAVTLIENLTVSYEIWHF